MPKESAPNWREIKSHLQSGRRICVSDSVKRENETDWALIGEAPTPQDIMDFIRIGGGVFVAYLPQQFFDRLGMKPLDELLLGEESIPQVYKDMARPSSNETDPNFVIWIRLRTQRDKSDTPTEIAATCQKLYEIYLESFEMIDEELMTIFGKTFAIGNVPLIAGARGLLKERQGHTEMLLSIAKGLDLPQIAFACELIDGLESMRPAVAKLFAETQRDPLVQLKDVLNLSTSAI